jgi:pimeloyl-ACP methyl ester carboxylesterase
LFSIPPREATGAGATFIRWSRRAGAVAAIAGAAAIFGLRVFYPKLLYPAPQHDANAPAEGKLLTTVARDGTQVHATEFAGPHAGPVLVYFHGNGVVMGDLLWMAREFVQRGVGVVLCEYRGYGLSAGSGQSRPSEAGLYEDAEAVLAAIAGEGITSDRIALFGESLGTGVAVEMAARGHGSSVVLVTPYTSIPEVASRFIFGLPAHLLMSERFDSFSKAARVTMPALLLHGTDDGVVPYAMGKALAAALPRARLITVPGGHHNDLFLGEGWRFFDEVAEFVHHPR